MADLERERDVVVVGAGPAGAAAAYYFARQGLDVLLLEAKKLPRQKPCGDGIGPRAVLALERMGLKDWLATHDHRINRIRIVGPSGASIASAPEPGQFPVLYGYVIKRTELDQKLAEHAAGAGAEVVEGFRAEAFLDRHGRTYTDPKAGVSGVAGKFNSGPRNIKAKLTVLADGSKGRLSRLCNPATTLTPALGLRAYATKVAGIDDCINIFFSRDFSNGYGWIFPLGPSEANIGVGLLGHENGDGKSIHGAYARFTKEQDLTPLSLADAQIKTRPAGSVMRMDFNRRRLRRPGLALIGDAAGMVSPLNGEGICHAVESAHLLGETMAGRFRSAQDIETGLSDFESAMRERFSAYFRWAAILSKLLSRPDRLDRIIIKARKDDYLRVALAGVLANTVHPRELGRLKFLAKLFF